MSEEMVMATETAVVGLSPSFWSHMPMSIAQFHSMELVRGIHCLRDGEKTVPVSRCRIMGFVVSVDRKASGMAIYVVDDGTGLVDCVDWNDNGGAEDILLAAPFSDSKNYETQFGTGDMVDVMGRIECVAIVSAGKNGQRICRRELHASSVRRLESSWCRAFSGCLDSESRHIVQCCSSKGRCNGLEVLSWLGPEIQQKVADRENFPSLHDATGSWRLFGINCPCTCEDLKEKLLYCHCIGTKAVSDPDWKYRDGLLRELIRLEETQNIRDNDEGMRPLCVAYTDLIEIGQRCTEQLGRPISQAKSILQQTLRVLCDDGILHLFHDELDEYLLVSMRAVLEPYVRLLSSKKADDIVVRSLLVSQKPPCLSKVPKARLQLVRRRLTANETEETTSC